MLDVDLRRVSVLLVLAGCLLSLAVPASAPASVGCPSQPTAQVFLPWADPAQYALVPDGGMETQAGAWKLSGQAAFVPGNEPFYVRERTDRSSLAIPAGASATSAPKCIAIGHPVLRFFARSKGAPPRLLHVAVEFTDLTGARRSQRIATLSSPSEWAPTPPVVILADLFSPLIVPDVSFRFESAGGEWRIDDVYVDPYGKG